MYFFNASLYAVTNDFLISCLATSAEFLVNISFATRPKFAVPIFSIKPSTKPVDSDIAVFSLSDKSVLSANSSYLPAPNTAPPLNVIALGVAPKPPLTAIAAVVGKLSAICSPSNLAASL